MEVSESINLPGSTTKNCFGSEKYYDLEKDFYKTENVKNMAKKFRKFIYTQL